MYWKKNNKIVVDSQGRPISCTSCPCGSIECSEAVDSEVQRLLALVDEHGHNVWSLQGTYEPPYRCAEWHYDSENEEWVLDHMAEGKLAVALRVGTKVSHTTDSTARYLVYAKSLYSESLEQWLTVGCECHVTDHVCKHRKVSLSDFNVAGLLDVWKPSESDSTQSYEPSDTCRVDVCELAKLKLQSAHDWHYGGTMYDEGFYDWWSSSTHTQSFYHFTKFLKGLYWNDFEIEESDSETITIDHWKFTYIPCSCDSQYPVHHELAENDKIHEYNGICDMESTCQNQVLFTLRSYLDSGDWEEVASVATDFVCAVYEGDTCVTPSSGNLCMAYSRPATLGYGTAISSGAVFVTATTLYNSTTNVYRTVGCRCYAGTWRYPECSQQFADLEGVCIGGVLPVAPDNCDRNACATYPCDDYALQWACYAEWYGCTLYGEGYLLKGTGFTNYDKFSMALKGTNNGVTWYAYVDCGCTTGHTGSRYSDELPSTWSLHELAGLCSNPECEQMLILKQQAQEQGWTWYDEGILVHKAWVNVAGNITIGDWYSLYTQKFSTYGSLSQYNYTEGTYYRVCKGCAEAPDRFYLVACNCAITEQYKTEGEDNPDAPQVVPSDYWKYLDMPNICTCDGNPIREILLSYPDVLGVEDVSQGNDTLYEGTYQTDGGMGTTDTYSYGDVCAHRLDRTGGEPYEGRRAVQIKIDYRCLCFLLQCFNEYGQEAYMIRTFYPEHSYAKPTNNNFLWSYHDWIFSTCHFNGHITPFAMCNDIYQIYNGTETFRGWAFGGMNYGWNGTGNPSSGYPALVNACPETEWTFADEFYQEDVENMAGCNVSSYSPCVINWGYDHDDDWQGQAVHSPDWTVGLIQSCAVENRGSQWSPQWYYKHKIFSCGVNMGVCDRWLTYHVQYAYTNLGYIVKSMGGYQTSFTILGARNLPANLRPSWVDPEDMPDDDTLTWTPQTDMEWCIEDFDYDSDSDGEISDSESISVSQGE